MILSKLKWYIIVGVVYLISSCTNSNTSNTSNLNPIDSSLGQLVDNVGDKIWKVHQDKEGNMWFGSNGEGVYCYNGKELRLFNTGDGLIDNTIRGIKEDHLGNIFIETPEGVSKFNGETFTTLNIISSDTNTWQLKPNDLWFNCNGNARDVYRYDGNALYALKLPTKDLNKAFNTLVMGLGFKDMNNSPYSVFGIDKDSKGHLWFGTAVAGAFRYDGESFLWFPEKELTRLPDGRVPGVRSMIEDKDGNFWLSNFLSKYKITETDSGAVYQKLEAINETSLNQMGAFPYFNSGVKDADGNLWMVTYSGGIWRYDGNTLTNFPVFENGLEVLLISIYLDDSGVFWLGTDNAGVYTFNGEKASRFYVGQE